MDAATESALGPLLQTDMISGYMKCGEVTRGLLLRKFSQAVFVETSHGRESDLGIDACQWARGHPFDYCARVASGRTASRRDITGTNSQLQERLRNSARQVADAYQSLVEGLPKPRLGHG